MLPFPFCCIQRVEEDESSNSSDSDPDAPRSAISGKKIKMKIHRDKALDKGRKDFLKFLNQTM